MIPAKKHPCAECPFKVGGSPGWMGSAAPEEYAASILSDERVPCHKSVDYDWHAKWVAGEAGVLCAGALVMAANLCKRTRDTERPVVPADREGVYARLPAMIDAHRSATVCSWQTPDDHHAVAEVRERLRMAPLAPKGAECAYPGCRASVTPDDHCFGCNAYVCEVHSTNVSLMGMGHDVTEHWEESDDE